MAPTLKRLKFTLNGERACNVTPLQHPTASTRFRVEKSVFSERSDKSHAALWHGYNIQAAKPATLQKQYSALQYGF